MLAAVATHQSYVSEETRIMALVQKGFKTVYLLLWVVIQRFYCPKVGAWEKLRATDYFDMTMLLKEGKKLWNCTLLWMYPAYRYTNKQYQ